MGVLKSEVKNSFIRKLSVFSCTFFLVHTFKILCLCQWGHRRGSRSVFPSREPTTEREKFFSFFRLPKATFHSVVCAPLPPPPPPRQIRAGRIWANTGWKRGKKFKLGFFRWPDRIIFFCGQHFQASPLVFMSMIRLLQSYNNSNMSWPACGCKLKFSICPDRIL